MIYNQARTFRVTFNEHKSVLNEFNEEDNFEKC